MTLSGHDGAQRIGAVRLLLVLVGAPKVYDLAAQVWEDAGQT
jgi:hypothetical protein